MTAPKSPRPITKPTALVTTKTRLRNSSSGRIGSAARRSTATKAANATTDATSMATMSPSSHGLVVPPRLV